MTVIELFERDPMDNIATCLSLRPDTLILVGEEEILDDSIERYRRFFREHGLPTRVTERSVELNNVTAVIALLTEIVKQRDTCVIDLAGGDEVLLAAAGIVHDRYKDAYPVSLQRMDAQTGDVQDCDGDGITKKRSLPRISVKELITLYGGSIVSSAPRSEGDATLEQLRPIWDAVTNNSDLWNRKVGALMEFERWARTSQQGLCITVNFDLLQETVANYDEKRALFDELVGDLHDGGILRITNRTKEHFSYTYKTAFARRCLRKAGNVLEYKTVLEARSLRKNGQPFFNDCLMGVTIDWDGVIHHSKPGGPKDTRNEIDVVAMHGLTPVFISCKNGDIKEVELYKLSTVADRFGGKHAKKILVATNFQPESEDAKNSLIQRAKDMGVSFQPNAASLTDEGWQALFLDPFAEDE